MPKIGWIELAIVFIIGLFLFRVARLDRLMRGLAEAVREFRRGLAGEENEDGT
jgi:TatA/E family protein of Tat protein translocase